eukprot:scaffold9195_cov69-Cyclotella_meneghiniana.AAC.4
MMVVKISSPFLVEDVMKYGRSLAHSTLLITYTLHTPSTLQANRQQTPNSSSGRIERPPELVNIVNIHTAHHNSASQLICYSPPEWRKESNK